jgi:hypothetical protein
MIIPGYHGIWSDVGFMLLPKVGYLSRIMITHNPYRKRGAMVRSYRKKDWHSRYLMFPLFYYFIANHG